MFTISNQNSTKFQQTFDHVFEPLRIPIWIGNEIFILTQQDIRNILDTRIWSLSKATTEDLNMLRNQLFALPAIQFNSDGRLNLLDNNINAQLNTLINAADFLSSNLKKLVLDQNSFHGGYYTPTNVMPAIQQFGFENVSQIVAPIQTQLDWEMQDSIREKPKSCFTYGKITSTSDLRDYYKNVRFAPEPTEISTISRGCSAIPEDIAKTISEGIAFEIKPSARQEIKKSKEKKFAM